MKLKKTFLQHCEKKKFEINQGQLDTIDYLSNYHRENFKQSFISNF